MTTIPANLADDPKRKAIIKAMTVAVGNAVADVIIDVRYSE